MKIISVKTDITGTYHIQGAADSAMLRVGEPLFLGEDQLKGWHSVISPAIRLCRMGMHIHNDFVPRYYDAITLMHILLPTGTRAGIVPALYRDRAIAPGKWLDIDSSDSGRHFAVTASWCDIDASDTPPTSKNIDFTLSDLGINRIISIISNELTFRQGDIIIFEDFGLDIGQPRLDTIVDGTINNDKLLSFKIK